MRGACLLAWYYALALAIPVTLLLACVPVPWAWATATATVADGKPACTTGTTIASRAGRVCGVTRRRVTSYLGIPFAAPPKGKLRWQPPQPVQAWQGVYSATANGPICVEPAGKNGVSGSEDCLNLNIQVPVGAPSHERLAVMVEIPGGGFLHDAFGPPPDAGDMIRPGHVIVVGINYRRGILGFLALKALGPHSGDYGLEDQIAALHWVRANIRRFGGDPANVTILGQSAGAASVCALMASPAAHGLFQKAIVESGFYNAAIGPDQVWAPSDCKSRLPSLAQAEKVGATFAAKLGCGHVHDVVRCLRGLPAKELVLNAGQVMHPDAGGSIAPIVNGTTLTQSPARAFARGDVAHVAVMLGVSRDEINGSVLNRRVTANTPAQYAQRLATQYGKLADKIRKRYRLVRFGSPFIAYRTVVADSDSVCPALATDRVLARHLTVFAFQNNDADTPPFNPARLPQGAVHGAERVFLPNTEPGLDADQLALGRQVIREWTNFARTGNPMAAHTPEWTPFTAASPMVLLLRPAGDSELVDADRIARRHHCRFWNAAGRQRATAEHGEPPQTSSARRPHSSISRERAS